MQITCIHQILTSLACLHQKRFTTLRFLPVQTSLLRLTA